MKGKFCFAIDRGGTFTDVYCICPGGKVRTLKLLSVDPTNYKDAPTEGIRRILHQEAGGPNSQDSPVNGSLIEWIRMGTTVATNALLERKGERCALVITKGFKDLLHIGNQARPKIFDLEIKIPGVLYDAVVEVDERVVLQDDRCCLDKRSWSEETGNNGELCYVRKPVDVDTLRKRLEELKRRGINSLAVALMHSYMYKAHEQLVKRIAVEVGFESISLSSEVMAMVRIVPRAYTACVDAYLTPLITRYVSNFISGFKNLENTSILFMQSDGGLTPVSEFTGSRAILSGPAGGVVGYAYTTHATSNRPIIGFDMGGTSTDVSRYAGQLDHIFESVTGGVTIQAPQLDIVTVAAGGGSVLSFVAGLFHVGPESAGAHPGPACYRKGGPLTITDANLVLGRLLPQYFPCIFGPEENESLNIEASRYKMTEAMNAVNEFRRGEAAREGRPFEPMTVEEVAMGFVRVANETMSRPIRNLTQARGYDTRDHELACFGGAGAQHACSVARALGMSRVHVHKYAGILSAFGMALADVVEEAQEFCGRDLDSGSEEYILRRFEYLESNAGEKLKQHGFRDADSIKFVRYLHLRYEGTDYGLMCQQEKRDSVDAAGFRKEFERKYLQEFGFIMSERRVIVDDIRVRGTGHVYVQEAKPGPRVADAPKADSVVQVYFVGGYRSTKVYLMKDLSPEHTIQGPAIVIDDLCTILVDPDSVANITSSGDIQIDVGSREPVDSKKIAQDSVDPIQLSIFSHRFMSIAEQMGRVLQRTAISTNIKERLDFSCALFGPDGGLVSNAPHIPVHLGSMQHAVQYQLQSGTPLLDGDVILSNHPSAGGTHLPDLTVITPVFRPNASTSTEKPVFYVASRGHHADIGGSRPGSMPPDSRTIHEEGASFKAFKIVSSGKFNEDELRKEFAKPGEHPGCSGTRNIVDNLADLKAQIAANRKGILLVNELIDHYGLPMVQSYMRHIQKNAELAVRDLLKARAKTMQSASASFLDGELGDEGAGAVVHRGGVVDRPVQLTAVDSMDDGTKIRLCVSISPKSGDAVFDFTGTGHQVWGNCNAPPAITYSAIIYCLRCMVARDIPLNQGCLNSVRVILPAGSILKPREDAAVVGGNVLTSQRLVDVIFKAFGACAASQGCTNNLTFGDETFGYYETIAGGSGAGPHWHGRSGVHTHMTNTRITDPEILERRYPVILEAFYLREGSGGKGRYNGGDGVQRFLRFRRPMDVSLLTERRVFQPYGMFGGCDGQSGLNLLHRMDGDYINLGSKAYVRVAPSDVLEIHTPGGGGWGGNYNDEEDEGCLLDEDIETAASLKAQALQNAD
ncbi:unnamed protein product [Notodromas monacha]|uniref:5-oxoprolinase n=1 Tax=Notodromas monacha TaxID=399045 RepID=A0A7R9GB48_9CRUS|nr:unnamed protein product [Notodromas monacha]CAG0914660.1 unnamed protein product [Notodromas monacha]